MRKQNQLDESGLRNLYQRLIQINQEAFAGEEYDVAYHSLMAALYCVQRLNDRQGLGEVERRANEELTWIDAHHPEYEHSTQSASTRGHSSIYKNLSNQARTRILITERGARGATQE